MEIDCEDPNTKADQQIRESYTLKKRTTFMMVLLKNNAL